MFKIRYEYKNLFPKQYNMDIEYKAKVEKFKADHMSEDNYSQDGNFGKSNKQIDRAMSAQTRDLRLYKVNYHLNLLP